jgi:cardiolipin synthase
MALATSGRPRGLTGAVVRVACFALTTAWQNTANLLTIARLLSIPVLVLCLIEGDYPGALLVFFLAALTDALDGFVAKRLTGCTPMGALLDPIADKLLLTSVFIALAMLAVLPAWLVALALLRDGLLMLGSIVLRLKVPGFRIAPHRLGKLCTFVQLSLAGLGLASLAVLPAAAEFLPVLVAGTAVLLVASGLTYLGGAARLLAQAPA